jgi:segregation and condensation protein B
MTNNDSTVYKFNSQDNKIAFIEAVLFVSKDPVKPEKFMNSLKLNKKEFNKLINLIDEKYTKSSKHGIKLKISGGGISLVTKPVYHSMLKSFFTIKTSSKLSLASLETLAIIAYRQPVTIAEISDMRKVNSVGPLKNLLQKKLIKNSGRKKVPGNPMLYSTTKDFLIYFGLNDVSELPSLEELTELFDDKEQPSLFK